MDWRYGLSGRVPYLQAGISEIKPQAHGGKKKFKERRISVSQQTIKY
jgi:hypothetical protein